LSNSGGDANGHAQTRVFTPVEAAPSGDAWREDPREFRLAVEVPAVFDPDECDRVVGYTAEFGQAEGKIAREDGSGDVDPEVRRVRQTGVPRNGETAWVYERLASAVDRCNQEFFGFDLRDFDRGLAIVDYRPGDFYDWHLDFGREASARKLSVSVALSSPDDYEGGGLAFPSIEFDQVARGSAVVFPSFLLHGVQPVKQGRRLALVAWVAGPRFR
jgi:PKHD-type hydroxylase